MGFKSDDAKQISLYILNEIEEFKRKKRREESLATNSAQLFFNITFKPAEDKPEITLPVRVAFNEQRVQCSIMGFQAEAKKFSVVEQFFITERDQLASKLVQISERVAPETTPNLPKVSLDELHSTQALPERWPKRTINQPVRALMIAIGDVINKHAADMPLKSEIQKIDQEIHELNKVQANKAKAYNIAKALHNFLLDPANLNKSFLSSTAYREAKSLSSTAYIGERLNDTPVATHTHAEETTAGHIVELEDGEEVPEQREEHQDQDAIQVGTTLDPKDDEEIQDEDQTTTKIATVPPPGV